MRKPVCLAVVGISIVVAAVSLGVTLTRYIGMRAYSPKGTAQAAATAAGPKVPATPPEEWNNLFAPGDGMRLASRLPAATGKAASQAVRTRFVLVGTIVSSTPSASRAILWANGMKEPKAYRESEEVEPGATLASVERDVAWIKRGNEKEKLEILPVGSHGRPMAAAAGPAPPPVASAAPSPASPAAAPTLPRAAPALPRATPIAPPLPGPQAVASPGTPSGDEEEERLSPARKRARRAPGLRR